VRHGYLHAGDDLDSSGLLKGSEKEDGMFQVKQADAQNWVVLKPLMAGWVRAFQEKLRSFNRVSEMKLRGDSYFTGNLPQNYPLEVTFDDR